MVLSPPPSPSTSKSRFSKDSATAIRFTRSTLASDRNIMEALSKEEMGYKVGWVALTTES